MREIEPEVIVSYDSKGNVKPYRMRFQAEDQSLIVVKIDRILYVDDNNRDSIFKYRCELTIQDRKRYADLFFHRLTMKWKLQI